MTLPDMHSAEAIPDSARAEIEQLLQSGDLFRYTAAADAPVSLLEAEFAQMMGSRYALAVSSCSAALFLSLLALDLPQNAKVLIPGFTFAAVPSAVIHANYTPVLCEVGANYRIDMADFAAKLPTVDAVIISHMRGHTSDMDAIMALCDAADIPVIEDAAHSLGTLWHDRKIGTIGKIGCFSFQSYKMVNAGEGGILITDDADLVARAIIMSGAYEHNWKKHPGIADAWARWQNQLPPETRAPDSIQFNLVGLDDAAIRAFADASAKAGVKVQVFGQSTDNARAFWNWQFIQDLPDLPQTRAMLMTACDVRLPVQLQPAELDAIVNVLLGALATVTKSAAA